MSYFCCMQSSIYPNNCFTCSSHLTSCFFIYSCPGQFYPCTFIEGYSPWYGWLVGFGLLALVLVLRGKRADAAAETAA